MPVASIPCPPLSWVPGDPPALRPVTRVLRCGVRNATLQIVQPNGIVPRSFRGRSLLDAMNGQTAELGSPAGSDADAKYRACHAWGGKSFPRIPDASGRSEWDLGRSCRAAKQFQSGYDTVQHDDSRDETAGHRFIDGPLVRQSASEVVCGQPSTCGPSIRRTSGRSRGASRRVLSRPRSAVDCAFAPAATRARAAR